MFDRLPTGAVIFALLAAAIHVLFFVLESLLFRRPFAWRTFGIGNQKDAETTRDWALNQGFYNLFLAVGVVVGVLLQASSEATTVAAGAGMVLLATASMVGAAVVLLVTKPALLRGVAIQGIAPLLAILSVLIGWAGRQVRRVGLAARSPDPPDPPDPPEPPEPPAKTIKTTTGPPDTVFYAVSD